MIRKTLICLACITIGNASFSQVPSVDQLKENAQKVRKIFLETARTAKKNAIALTTYVNPFIGTGGHGHTYPGASAPFGMMQLSPDTRFDGWDGCSGYHYSDSIIYGFSHTHLSGTGVPDYCDLLIVPQQGKAVTTPRYKHPDGYGARFSHASEVASPGYYQVKLLDQAISVRLTVSERAGMHEYNFLNSSGQKFILIDLDHRDKLLQSSVTILNDTTVSGSRVSEAWANNQHFYFYLNTSVPFEKATPIDANGEHKLLLTFPENTAQIRIKVGMSAVDCEGAKNNLSAEITDWNFDVLRMRTEKKWNDELSKISIEAPDRKTMVNFYTALYHSFLAPNLFSDVDGRYRGRDNVIHTLTDKLHPQYTVFSLWDTYRATHPLFTLTQQRRTSDFIQTFLRQYEQGKDLPVWELAGNETECMIGYHSVSVIADAYTKNIRDFDQQLALKAMLETSKLDEYGKVFYGKNGYISTAQEPESVSKTLEYAYDDFCISQFAYATGNKREGNQYLARSFNFINAFDPNTRFMRARRGGVWLSPFDPAEVNANYTEANSWQYSLYAPHAVGVLEKLLGGKEALETWLDRLFTTKSELTGRQQVDITGLVGQYAHGNEPSHHIAYLYNYTNSPKKTQFYVDKLLKEMYSNSPDGLSGNEDCGQMSSWYVMSVLGLYQIAPSRPIYDIGRPLISNAKLQLENGKTLLINALNNAPDNKYIQSLTFNGEQLSRNYLSHEELMQGGTLEFTMGSQPETERGKLTTAPTLSTTTDFVPIPYVDQESLTFENNTSIQLAYPNYPTNATKTTIYYSLNDGKWLLYSSPISISQTTKISAKCVAHYGKTEKKESAVIENTFVKRDASVHLSLQSTYSNQYAAGGSNALIDGMRGGKEFRTGDWQGFYGQDVVAEVTFDQARTLSEIGVSCIKDMKSWIFYPSEVTVEWSFDGTHFEAAQHIATEQAGETLQFPAIAEYVTLTNTKQAIKKIRFIAKNPGKCPAWHLGAGNDTWVFVDELIFK